MDFVTLSALQIAFFTPGAITAIVAIGLVLAFKFGFLRFLPCYERHLNSVQSTHLHPTPRLGGVAIMAGFIALATVGLPNTAVLVTVSIAPIFIVGLLEDLGVPMSPRRRLASVAVSCLIEIVLRGVWMQRYDLLGFDELVAQAAFGIPVTLLLVGGISHAFNLIDGLNGLASGVAALAACALGTIAMFAGDVTLATTGYMFGTVIAGFMPVNFPFGKLFLGDAGAYCVGYILAWIGIALVMRNPDVSAWSVFLVFLWPVAETFWAIFRRKIKGLSVTAADRMHMHHVVMRGLEIAVLGPNRRTIANPLATMLLLPLAAAPVTAGVLLWREPLAGFAASVGFLMIYILTYVAAVRVLPKLRTKVTPRNPVVSVP
ncbi:MAG: MraY family glycosyltransferase [Pseudomonadota bacterium]